MLRCLIVEDNPNFIIVAEIMLQNIAKKISRDIVIIGKAENYDKAEVMLNQELPDIVLLDLNLKKDDKTGHDLFVNYLVPKLVPVIIISGENETGLVAPQYSLFNIPFLDKPLVEDKLLAEIKKISHSEYKDSIKRKYELFSKISNADIINDRIELKDGHNNDDKFDSIVLLSDILYIVASGQTSYCVVKNKSKSGYKSIPCKEEFGDLIKRLSKASLDSVFIKIGRDYLFNKRHIKGVNKDTKSIILSDEQHIPVNKDAFKRFIGK